MKIYIEKLPRGMRPRDAIRRCGYAEHLGRNTSYSKRLATYDFPRLHVYIEENGSKVCFNLHLDQKAVSYEGSHAHSGEYEGSVVEQEALRIQKIIASQEEDFDEDD